MLKRGDVERVFFVTLKAITVWTVSCGSLAFEIRSIISVTSTTFSRPYGRSGHGLLVFFYVSKYAAPQLHQF